jgi:hypothetical protein
MIKWLALLATMAVIGNVLFLQDVAKAERMYNMCKVYYKHGNPTFIEVDGKEYDVNNFSEIDKLRLNPWVKEFMDSTKVSDCLQIKE